MKYIEIEVQELGERLKEERILFAVQRNVPK